jgi:hypothetical protein
MLHQVRCLGVAGTLALASASLIAAGVPTVPVGVSAQRAGHVGTRAPNRNGVDGPLTTKEWGHRPIHPNGRACRMP